MTAPATLTVFGVKLRRDREWTEMFDDSYAWKGSRGRDEALRVQHYPGAKKKRDTWYVNQNIGDCDGSNRKRRGLAPEHYFAEFSGYGATLDAAVEDLLAAKVALTARLTRPR